jgi:hypothetical protein
MAEEIYPSLRPAAITPPHDITVTSRVTAGATV